MSKYKTYFLILILILEIVVLLPFITSGVRKNVLDVFPELKGQLKAEFGLRGVKAYGISDDQSKYFMDIQRASFYQLTQEISGDDFKGSFWDSRGKPIHVQSSIVFYNVESKKVAVPAPGSVDLEKDGYINFINLLYDRPNEKIYCDKGATYYYPNHDKPQVVAAGINVKFDRDTKKIMIGHDFKVDYFDTSKSNTNFNVISSSGIVDLEKNHVSFFEQVHLTQKDFKLSSDTLDVDYERGKKKSGIAVANGNVEILDNQFDRKAYSQSALYNQTTNEITLTGLPVVEQGNDKLAGEKIKINKNNDYIEVINASAKIEPK